MSAYQNLDERVPDYEVNLEAQVESQARTERANLPVLYVKEIHACCIVISALNFICCSWMGIPALIFTILGREADTKRDKASAERHRLYMSIFNTIGGILFLIAMSIYVIVGVGYSVGMAEKVSASRNK